MIRFYNGKLLSLSGGFEISDWEVWVEETMILYVGPAIGAHPPFEREIDLKGNLLMPGFKNAHAHSAMTFLRSYADDLPLQSWLFDKVFPLEAKLTPDDIYALTKLAILEYLKGGITSAFDMYYKRDAFAQASIDCGFRMVLCGALAAGDDWTVGEMDTIKFNNLHPLISYIPGIHAEYTANLDLLMFMKMLLDEYKMPFFTHNSETKREVEECIARHGLTPTQLFEENGLFEHGGGGFHCVWFDETDMDIFARRGLYGGQPSVCDVRQHKARAGVYGDACLHQQRPYRRFHRAGVVQAGMLMAGEGYVFMTAVHVGDRQQRAAAHRGQLLCRGQPSVVAHNTADETGSQQHIGALSQNHSGSLKSRAVSSGAAAPAAPCHQNRFFDSHVRSPSFLQYSGNGFQYSIYGLCAVQSGN